MIFIIGKNWAFAGRPFRQRILKEWKKWHQVSCYLLRGLCDVIIWSSVSGFHVGFHRSFTLPHDFKIKYFRDNIKIHDVIALCVSEQIIDAVNFYLWEKLFQKTSAKVGDNESLGQGWNPPPRGDNTSFGDGGPTCLGFSISIRPSGEERNLNITSWF